MNHTRYAYAPKARLWLEQNQAFAVRFKSVAELRKVVVKEFHEDVADILAVLEHGIR